jgi:hypothetical protein
MRHPIHGAKVVSSQFEKAHDEAHGWSEFDPINKSSKIAPTPLVSAAEQTQPAAETEDEGDAQPDEANAQPLRRRARPDVAQT